MESNNQKNEDERKNLKSKLNDLKEQLSEKPSVLPNIQSNDNTNSIPAFLRPLNEQQKIFVNEYLKEFNGAEAARRAGYAEDSANVQASRLLTYDNIKYEISKRQALLAEASNITREKQIAKLFDFIEDCYNDEKIDRNSILKAYDMIHKLTNLYGIQTQINIQNNNIDITKLFGFENNDNIK